MYLDNKMCKILYVGIVSISNSNLRIFRKVRPHGNHYGSMMQQPLLTNQMAVSAHQPISMAVSAHQPISIGIAHMVWPQSAANKRNKPCPNR